MLLSIEYCQHSGGVHSTDSTGGDYILQKGLKGLYTAESTGGSYIQAVPERSCSTDSIGGCHYYRQNW